jgi:recombination protein RecT
MKIHTNIEQGTADWKALRAFKITASEAAPFFVAEPSLKLTVAEIKEALDASLITFDKKALNKSTGKWEVVETNVQLIVGYKGLIDLARRSGHITSISANIHHSDDELWDYEEGTEAKLRHRPGPMAGARLHAYAIAKFKDGGHAYVVLPWAHVMKIRDGSQGWQQAVRTKKTADSPWEKHVDEMAKKTAIRALAKYLPLSVEFMDAMAVDEAPADFRGFAMDPTAGLNTEDDPIEGDVDTMPEKQIEDTRRDQEVVNNVTTTKSTETQQKTPVQQQSRTSQSKPDQEQVTQKSLLDHADEGRAEPVDAERWGALADMILDELKTTNPDDVEEMYGGQIEQMKAHPKLAPLAAEIEAAIEKARQNS